MSKKFLLVVALGLVFQTAVLPAGAETIDLWADFPDTQGQNNFYALAVKDTGTGPQIRYLEDAGTYSFDTPGQPWNIPHIVKQNDGWLFMHPSAVPQCGTIYGKEYVVLAWQAPYGVIVNTSGTFMNNGGGDIQGSVGWSDGSTGHILWSSGFFTWGEVPFAISNVSLAAGHYLFFQIDAGSQDYNDWGHLKGSIVTSPVPLPGSLLLLGSGLLGLVGVAWRRRG